MSSVPAGAGFVARAAQRVEVYALVPAPDGGPLLLPGSAAPRVPGAVLGHGEHPRDAAARALPAEYLGRGSGRAGHHDALRVLEVLSDVRPGSGSPDRRPARHPGLHVLRVVYVAAGGAEPSWWAVEPDLLREPDAAPGGDPVPGGPPRVQRPAAYAVVVRDGAALLTRVTGHGVWTLPGGGIDHGEHPDTTVRRETLEETGLRLASAHLDDVGSRHFTGHSPAQITEDFHGVRMVYRGTVDERHEPRVVEVGGTTDAAAWIPLDLVPTLHLTDVARVALGDGR